MSEAYLGEIRTFPYNYAPSGWMLCDGQVLDMQKYMPLFSVIGNRFGGDGVKTFALPNLAGKIAVGAGDGVGLTPRLLGAEWGMERVSLSSDHLPPHRHALTAVVNSSATGVKAPSDTVMIGRTVNQANFSTDNNVSQIASSLNDKAVSYVGGTESHENRQPVLGIRFCICVEDGEYPVKPD